MYIILLRREKKEQKSSKVKKQKTKCAKKYLFYGMSWSSTGIDLPFGPLKVYIHPAPRVLRTKTAAVLAHLHASV